uniref:hypothetical protein n=1 Tax=uncultured Halovibrio sp. TaxID=985049 RepID=UPI0025F90E58
MIRRSIFVAVRPRDAILGIAIVAIVAVGTVQWLQVSLSQQMEMALVEDALRIRSGKETPGIDTLAARESVALAARLEQGSGAVLEEQREALSRRAPPWFESAVVNAVPER